MAFMGRRLHSPTHVCPEAVRKRRTLGQGAAQPRAPYELPGPFAERTVSPGGWVRTLLDTSRLVTSPCVCRRHPPGSGVRIAWRERNESQFVVGKGVRPVVEGAV